MIPEPTPGFVLVCRVCKCPTPMGHTCWCSRQCEEMERAGVEMMETERIARRLLRCYGLDRERAGGVATVVELAAAIRACKIETLEEAAKIVEAYGPQPPNPNGRRAELAAIIRARIAELKEKQT